VTRRVAILGAGIGAEHLDGYLKLPDRFTVAAICDRDAARAAPLAEKAGASIIDDIAPCLADPSLDIIDVCLPPHLHAPVTRAALEAGKVVICEKPLAASLHEADRIAETAARTGGHVFPVFQYRYGRAVTVLRALRDQGLVGAPHAAAIITHWSRDAAYYAIPWRGTWEHEMGGAILSHAIHAHDLIGLLFDPVTSVSAMLATRINPIETEDCAAITMGTESGALVTSSITLGAAGDVTRFRLVYNDLTVESGTAPYNPAAADWRFTARDPARQADVDAAIAAVPTPHEGYAGYFEDIADALDGRPSNAVRLADGIQSIALASAIYHADRTGTRVSLPLDRSLPIAGRLAPG